MHLLTTISTKPILCIFIIIIIFKDLECTFLLKYVKEYKNYMIGIELCKNYGQISLHNWFISFTFKIDKNEIIELMFSKLVSENVRQVCCCLMNNPPKWIVNWSHDLALYTKSIFSTVL